MFTLLLVGTSSVTLIIPLLLNLPRTFAFTQCYYPDGSVPIDYVWEPCNSTDGKVSSCCIPSEGDICQDNGLCYYPPYGQVFRGTCTDRTWNDPACKGNICVTGFEKTWTWATLCKAPTGDESYACGPLIDNSHSTANCSTNLIPQTVFNTVTPTTPASRYTSPPPVDTLLYSVYTESYTTIITANVQTATLTSTFESTLTSTLSHTSGTGTAAGTGTSTGGSSTGTSAASNSPGSPNKVTLSTGVLASVIAGPIALIAICAFVLLFLRKRRAAKRVADGIRLSSGTNYPPHNGPVGADQVNPYEVPAVEAKTTTVPADTKYLYTSVVSRDPSPGAYEMNGDARREKWPGRTGAVEVGGGEITSPQSPAPLYSERPEVMPVEMDGTSSFRGRR